MTPAIISAATMLALWYSTLFTSAWEKSPVLDAYVDWVVRHHLDQGTWEIVFLAIPLVFVLATGMAAFHVAWTFSFLLQ